MVHPQRATIPAQAACAADKQGKFKEMYSIIFEKGYPRNFGQEDMEKFAKEIGLNVNKLKSDMKGECQKVIRKDQAEMSKVGTTGTPAFYINGRFLSGARPIDQFKRIIDEELEKANKRISQGNATVKNYYEKFVWEKGKKKLDK